jgi:hypothetical protein
MTIKEKKMKKMIGDHMGLLPCQFGVHETQISRLMGIEAREAVTIRENKSIGYQRMKEVGIIVEEAEWVMDLEKERAIELMPWVDVCPLFCGIEVLN